MLPNEWEPWTSFRTFLLILCKKCWCFGVSMGLQVCMKYYFPLSNRISFRRIHRLVDYLLAIMKVWPIVSEDLMTQTTGLDSHACAPFFAYASHNVSLLFSFFPTIFYFMQIYSISYNLVGFNLQFPNIWGKSNKCECMKFKPIQNLVRTFSFVNTSIGKKVGQ